MDVILFAIVPYISFISLIFIPFKHTLYSYNTFTCALGHPPTRGPSTQSYLSCTLFKDSCPLLNTDILERSPCFSEPLPNSSQHFPCPGLLQESCVSSRCIDVCSCWRGRVHIFIFFLSAPRNGTVGVATMSDMTIPYRLFWLTPRVSTVALMLLH